MSLSGEALVSVQSHPISVEGMIELENLHLQAIIITN